MNKDTLIKITLLFVFALFLYSLIERIPNIDDAWLGEHAFWMSKLGYVKSELMRGITHQEIRFLCHHKLFTLQGALFIRLFGFSVYTLKLLSLLYLAIFILIFFLFFYKKIFSAFECCLFLLLLISNAWVFEQSFIFRPEISLMTLGFISYLFIDSILKNSKNSITYAIISGIIAGLCVSTHLNGVIFPIAGFILLLWNRKFLLGIIFGISSLPAIAIYFYDFSPVFNFQYWLYQFNETPSHDRISNLSYVVSYLLNLANEHLRFLHSPSEIIFSVLFLTVFIYTYKSLKEYKNLIRFSGLLIFSLALLSVHKASYYMILYLPYLLILIILGLRQLKTTTSKKAILSINYIIALYLIINLLYDFKTSNAKYNIETNKLIVQKYIKVKTDTCRIVAPMTFIFNEILDFKSIQGDMCYSELQKTEKSIYKEGFLRLTKKFDIDYIILSDYSMKSLGTNELTKDDFSKNDCELIVRTSNMCIIKNKKTPNFVYPSG